MCPDVLSRTRFTRERGERLGGEHGKAVMPRLRAQVVLDAIAKLGPQNFSELYSGGSRAE